MNSGPSISERPLWQVGLLIALYFLTLGLGFVWFMETYADAIVVRTGSPLYAIAGFLLAYAIVPLVSSLFPIGREVWPMISRGRTPLRSALYLVLTAGAFAALNEGLVYYARHVTS